MFILSKIVWALFQPSALVGIVLLLGTALALARRRRAGLRLLAGGAALYLVFGFSPLSNWLLVPLENWSKPAQDADLVNASGIIVLGGAIGAGWSPAEPRLNEAGERMVESLRLARHYPALPVIFTGGKGDLFPDDGQSPEAEMARRFFDVFDIRPPRLKLEDRSRNTYENALLSSRLLHPKPGQTWIVVTSAWHMPRAVALFEKQGFAVLPRPVDYKTSLEDRAWRFFARGGDGLHRMDIAAKEWTGLIVSWIIGDLDWPNGLPFGERRAPEAKRISAARLDAATIPQ